MRPMLGKAEKMAMFLGQTYGIKADAMGVHLGVAKRSVYYAIDEVKKSIPGISEAIDCFNTMRRNLPTVTSRKDAETQTEDLASSKSDKCQLVRTISRLKSEKKSLGIQLARVQYLLSVEKSKLECQNMDPNDSDDDDNHVISDAGNDLFNEVIENHGREPPNRRYSEQMFRFAYVLLSYSPRAFHFVRQQIPLPCKSRVYTKFGPCIMNMKLKLTHLSKIRQLLQDFLQRESPETRITCTLGVDAFAFRLFLRSEVTRTTLEQELTPSQLRQIGPLLEDQTLLDELLDDEEGYEECDEPMTLTREKIDDLFTCINYCFIFLLQPLNANIPCLTLHLLPTSSGVATEDIQDTVDELIEICKDEKVDIRYVSADGDCGWNCRFRSMFKVMESVQFTDLGGFSLDVFEKCEKSETPLAVTDLLHCVKAARGRFIDHTLVIWTSDLTTQTNYEAVCRVLNSCSRSLSDRTQMGRMRDFYPIELFTIGNVVRLLQHRLFPDAFYFLSYSLLLVVIRVPFLRMDFRMQLLSAAYGLFSYIHNDIERMTFKPKDKRVPQRYKGKAEYITFAELQTVQRILCTITAYASAFQLHSEDLRTDALGTHIVEQRIGQSRKGSDSRWDRVLSLFAQGTIRNMLLEEDGLKSYTHGRLKNAGCRLNDHGDWFLEDFDATLLCRVLINSLTEAGRTPEEFTESLKQVSLWLKQLDQVLVSRQGEIGKTWLPTPVANCSITARLLKSSLDDFGFPVEE